jgi:hypothetical protein
MGILDSLKGMISGRRHEKSEPRSESVEAPAPPPTRAEPSGPGGEAEAPTQSPPASRDPEDRPPASS